MLAPSPPEPADGTSLESLLSETRILLPGTEVLLGFLATLPFTRRFNELGRTEHLVFICTFFATMLAFACFMAPTAYHRIARPIHHTARFESFANTFLVLGLVPVSVSLPLATYLVTSVAVGRTYAIYGAVAIAVFVVSMWWVVPALRAHDRFGASGGRSR